MSEPSFRVSLLCFLFLFFAFYKFILKTILQFAAEKKGCLYAEIFLTVTVSVAASLIISSIIMYYAPVSEQRTENESREQRTARTENRERTTSKENANKVEQEQ
jgi:mannitol-specific phosphotransferase system IIBC component